MWHGKNRRRMSLKIGSNVLVLGQSVADCIWRVQRILSVKSYHTVTVGVVCFSWTCSGHDELRYNKGSSVSHHVVAARSFHPQVGRRQHFYQELGQEHRQQGSVWHVLGLWQHFVLQGRLLQLWHVFVDNIVLWCLLINLSVKDNRRCDMDHVM